MNATLKKFLLPCALILTLGACANARDTRMAEGAGLGGVGGAIVGGVAANSVGGAVVGGIAGAAVGAVVADATRPRRAGRNCHFDAALDRRICRYR